MEDGNSGEGKKCLPPFYKDFWGSGVTEKVHVQANPSVTENGGFHCFIQPSRYTCTDPVSGVPSYIVSMELFCPRYQDRATCATGRHGSGTIVGASGRAG